MKLRLALVALAHCFFLASAANAVIVFNATTTVTGGRPLNGVQIGDTVTVNVRMSNPTAVAIFGVGAGIEGWNQSFLSFTSGEVNLGKYFCTNVACTLGLDNAVVFPNSDENTGNWLVVPSDRQTIAGVGNYIPMVQSVATTGRAGTGARDPGLDGVVDGGDAQFRFVFTAVANGATSITIGNNANPTLGNVVVLAGGTSVLGTNAVLNITVPEPGAIAAGLAALGSVGAVVGLRRRFEV